MKLYLVAGEASGDARGVARPQTDECAHLCHRLDRRERHHDRRRTRHARRVRRGGAGRTRRRFFRRRQGRLDRSRRSDHRAARCLVPARHRARTAERGGVRREDRTQLADLVELTEDRTSVGQSGEIVGGDKSNMPGMEALEEFGPPQTGPLGMPGSYKVQMSKRVGGVVTPLGEPVAQSDGAVGLDGDIVEQLGRANPYQARSQGTFQNLNFESAVIVQVVQDRKSVV